MCEREREYNLDEYSLQKLPDKAVIFAMMILNFKDANISYSLKIVCVLLQHVRLTTIVFSPMLDTLNGKLIK